MMNWRDFADRVVWTFLEAAGASAAGSAAFGLPALRAAAIAGGAAALAMAKVSVQQWLAHRRVRSDNLAKLEAWAIGAGYPGPWGAQEARGGAQPVNTASTPTPAVNVAPSGTPPTGTGGVAG